jgi:hypothetical protein
VKFVVEKEHVGFRLANVEAEITGHTTTCKIADETDQPGKMIDAVRLAALSR